MGWEGKGVGVYLCGRVYLPGRAGDFDPPRLTDRAAPATLADRGGEGAKENEITGTNIFVISVLLQIAVQMLLITIAFKICHGCC